MKPPLLTTDDRGISIQLTHVAGIAITTVLITVFLLTASSYVESEQERVANAQLATVGDHLATEVQRVDALSQQGGNVTVRTTVPARVSGKNYDVALESGDPCNTNAMVADECLVLETEGLDATKTVPLNLTADVNVSHAGGGVYLLSASGSGSKVTEVQPIVQRTLRIGVGQEFEVDRFGTVHSPRNEAPVPGIEMSPDRPTSTDEITLDAKPSEDPDGEIVAYRWKVGDDDAFTRTGRNITLDPSEVEPGPMEITLEVEDDDGGITRLNPDPDDYAVSGLVYEHDLNPVTLDHGVSDSGLQFTVSNEWSDRLEIEQVLIDPEGSGIDSVDHTCSSCGGYGSNQPELFVDVHGNGIDDGEEYIPDRSFPEGGWFHDFDYPVTVGTGDEAEIRIGEFEDGGGTPIDLHDEQFTLGVRYEVDGEMRSTVFTDVVGAPRITSFDVQRSGQDVDLVIQSTKELDTIEVDLEGTEDGSLQRSDFSESTSGGGYEYEAEISDGTDGVFHATLVDAESDEGVPSQETPVADGEAVLTDEYVWDDSWDDATASRGIVNDSRDGRDDGSISIGYPARDAGGSNLTAYWPFNTDDPEDLVSDHPTDVEDAPEMGVLGHHGTAAYRFRSADENYLQVDDAARFQGGDGATITASAWFRPGSVEAANGSTIVGKMENGPGAENVGWGLMIRETCPDHWANVSCGGTGPYVGYYGEEDGDKFGVFSGPIDTDRWQHAAIVLDEPNDAVHVYHDGQLIASNTSAPDHATGGSSSSVWIGGNLRDDEYFDGKVENVRLYDRLLDNSEVDALYQDSFRGELVTDWRNESTALDPAELELSYDAEIEAGQSINVTVQADTNGDGSIDAESDSISLDDGVDSKEVEGITDDADRFRLVIEMDTVHQSHTPRLHAVGLREET